ncbi:sodium:calcium antiporter [Rhodovibrio sodomensis]|uniref:Sodium:calcium antiporter n=1 Tax=Rhodovibrio sodomensis TaxID=1088 RepID=A0ABS1DAY8_9PROT|nr:calcium/sodium antiporter [Rhodovibrio sodomensis]MBK1667540.1 sodium:calcium antiporter [Rhodovibrio sodomensis]
MNYVLAIGGLVLLFLGGESLVRGAVGLARKLDVSPLFTGLVVVGFGTSAPEFVVCLEAALRGQYDITIGNIVGSNIANLMLILGVAGMIQPILSRASIIKRDGLAMLLGAAVLVGLAFLGEVSRLLGILLLLMLVGFIAACWISERATKNGDSSEIEEEIEEEVGKLPASTWVAVFAVLAGIVGLVLGSNMLIEGATGIARDFGISQAVIGVTLVAIGTSLPELAAVIVAAIRNHADVALGNVLGSNVFNVFGMLGLTAVIQPLTISRAFLDLDMWVMLGVSALLLVFLTTGSRLNRGESLLLLAGYTAYVVFLLDPTGMPGAAA